MLLIQNKRVNWDTHQIGIPGATAKDKENRRIPFNPNGRLAAILKRRAEGACRLLADGVDIRIIQLMLGHASIQQTQRYLNVTDEELRKGLEVSWGRQLRVVSGVKNRNQPTPCPKFVPRRRWKKWLLGLDSNQQPSG